MKEDADGLRIFGYNTWAEEVVHLVQAVGRVRGKRDNEEPREFLERCRQDEPQDMFDMGETPMKYAAFLISENEEDGDTGYLEEVEL